ncbi:MAG: hypothetical protein AAB840_01885 [Patescibacteria group bacterium]
MAKAKKKTTIDSLAMMVAKGFEETNKSIESLKTETKEGFEQVNERFDKIENLILIDHKRRIERLEVDIKELKNALAM